MEDIKLQMKVDMNIIQHLGISMYSHLSPVIAELISNAWDADATEVVIELYDQDAENKKIIVRDNGTGMDLQEIQNNFLIVGKNRRKLSDTTGSGRKVIGRKGIGKLSIFGIADEVIITTIKKISNKNIKNSFKLNLQQMAMAGETYYPEHIIKNQETDENTGTIIEILKIRRKSSFNPEKIAVDLARSFLIFDRNFSVGIKYNNKEPIPITQDLRFKDIEVEFLWNIPDDIDNHIRSSYSKLKEVKGIIYSTLTPVPEELKGIYLVSRGKIVHRNDFYGIRSSDYAHAYMTGWLTIDFIDENPDEDNISTNRQELIWEKEELQDLRNYLQQLISFITQDWRKKRSNKKQQSIRDKTNIDINSWINSIDSIYKPVAKKIIDTIINSESLDEGKSAEMVKYIHDMFEFDSFRNIAAELINSEEIDNNKIIDLLKKWEVVEAREMYKLSKVRVDTIKSFEKLIQENAREVPTMHNFFKKFPWLLDPRIIEFKDEARFSTLLREKFKDNKDNKDKELNEEDRRIDFLCIRLGGTFFIVELKRPLHTLRYNDIDQAKDYRTFIEKKSGMKTMKEL